ncbi:MAG: protocatechuate 3,4-dioxygenase, beta subunit [Acetobacteraceae bacterium]|jgi:protocatechuate 3,4-dioxygenase beta subunit|nr:protocatechuate 3,4-dioxygenase [Rhodopila sp.]MEA2727296.1 protocatechuate 3,4-dioxygenase, beta subunit [Acetobacteraceae bacterium]MEA2773344.1 protocatechuate 3,4-dioxygenase, beta subunit [Acetobacteraceae bacterium]
MADVAIAEKSATTKLPRTPPQILGPFYPFMHTPIETCDLTGGGKAQGTVLYLSGRVLADNGQPVAGAKVEIWQANAAGRYAHPNDDNLAAPLDEKFNGFAVTTTDGQGRYAFKTVRPAAYPAAPGRWRPAHIHFSVTAKYEQLVTQMYFKGGEWNDTDSWLNSASRKDLLITDPTPAIGKEPNAQEVTFDIVLTRG